jgi:hypothetical protein
VANQIVNIRTSDQRFDLNRSIFAAFLKEIQVENKRKLEEVKIFT